MKNQPPQNVKEWLKNLHLKAFLIEPLKGDASFRQYYRIKVERNSYILMDSSLSCESALRFVKTGEILKRHNLLVPTVYEANLKEGLLLLSDFGDKLYLNHLNNQTADNAYKKAIEALLTLQSCKLMAHESIPSFDQALCQKEMNLFCSWYIPYYLKRELSSKEQEIVNKTFSLLTSMALSQPKVFIHRDYHSRNLMLSKKNQLAILDFQDALVGPITYDIVSLLKDCYIAWPEERRLNWLKTFYQQIIKNEKLLNTSFTTFVKWFDWMGLQRHLKCLGLFVRLKLKENKNYHLTHRQRILVYVKQVLSSYEELKPFEHFFRKIHRGEVQ